MNLKLKLLWHINNSNNQKHSILYVKSIIAIRPIIGNQDTIGFFINCHEY